MSTIKRQRSDFVMDERQLKSDRDCFDAVVRWRPDHVSETKSHHHVAARHAMRHDGSRNNQEHHRHYPPRSSWLCHVDLLACSEQESSRPLQQTTQARSNLEPMDEDDGDNIQDTIRSLSIQLLQVKRRMSPAAERCTEAHNSLYGSPLTTGRKEFTKARNACNPYEILGGGRGNRGLGYLFMNRAAIKLANIDAILDFSLTAYNPQDGPFVFVDLCGAPGGFSEYIMRRCCAWQIPACRGYGMSLQGTNEYGAGTPWKLQDMTRFENGSFLQFRICEGVDGTGDVFRWDNVEALKQMMTADIEQPRFKIASCTEANENANQVGKAHLVLADGGFDAQRDSEHQEELAQKLVICEVAAGLALLRRGGTLVVKMFGFQTEVIRTLARDLHSMFQQLVALKPISSRPASAERYLVCTNFRGLPSSDWDGRKWSSRIFLGQYGQPQQLEATHAIDRYLDQFDCDMLGLNLKACFYILSFLESKCLAAAAGQSNSFDSGFSSNTNDCSSNDIVDIEAYKRAWQLV